MSFTDPSVNNSWKVCFIIALGFWVVDGVLDVTPVLTLLSLVVDVNDSHTVGGFKWECVDMDSAEVKATRVMAPSRSGDGHEVVGRLGNSS